MEHKTELQLKSEQITRLQNRVAELKKENHHLKCVLQEAYDYRVKLINNRTKSIREYFGDNYQLALGMAIGLLYGSNKVTNKCEIWKRQTPESEWYLVWES